MDTGRCMQGPHLQNGWTYRKLTRKVEGFDRSKWRKLVFFAHVMLFSCQKLEYPIVMTIVIGRMMGIWVWKRAMIENGRHTPRRVLQRTPIIILPSPKGKGFYEGLSCTSQGLLPWPLWWPAQLQSCKTNARTVVNFKPIQEKEMQGSRWFLTICV